MEEDRADGTAEAGTSSQTEASPVVAEPTKRLKRPVKPDKEEHQLAIGTLQAEINKRRTRSDALLAQIQQKKQSGGSEEMVAERKKLAELNASWKTEARKRSELREQIKALDVSRNDLRAQIRELRIKLGPNTTVQKIDEKIRFLEHSITHTTLALKDENKFREEMKKTATLKPMAAQYAAHQEKLKASDRERESLFEQMKVLEVNMNNIKNSEDQQKEVVNQLREKEAAKTQDIPSLIREKDECREVMNALYNKIQQLRDEFKQRNNVFWEESQAFREQQKQERAERDALREKEYQAKQAERQAQAAEFAGEPYHKEVGLCEQLLSHLSKYTLQAQSQSAASATTASAKESNAPFDGMKAISKTKKDDDEFGGFMGSAVKKGKGAKKTAIKQANSSQASSGQKLNHSLDMIDAFSKLKVSVPTTTDKVPAAVEEVEKSKAYWLKKREEVKETGVMPEEPTTSAANGFFKPAKATKKGQESYNLLEDFPNIDGHLDSKAAGSDGVQKTVQIVLTYLKDAVKIQLLA